MTTLLPPWQPRAVERMVAHGCHRGRAERIAAAIESQTRVDAADHTILHTALDLGVSDAKPVCS